MIDLNMLRVYKSLISRIKKHEVYYISEGSQWSINQDGLNLCRSMDRIRGSLEQSSRYIYNSILHFGSINSFCWNHGQTIAKFHDSNKVVVTWFHISPNDPRLLRVREFDRLVDLWHTSCVTTKNGLIEAGVDRDKIVVIPIGVDISAINRVLETSKLSKEILGIGSEYCVIGSFQKDGQGWDQGKQPKLIKGPDLFLECLDRVKEKLNPFVLLTGPSRGYVKSGLEERGIPYKHFYPRHFDKVISYYSVLDFYLMSSRVEGGPKSSVETAAARVPLVATKVGMVRDHWQDGVHAFLSEPADVVSLANNCLKAASLSKIERTNLTDRAFSLAVDFSYKKIAREYEERIYIPLMKKDS